MSAFVNLVGPGQNDKRPGRARDMNDAEHTTTRGQFLLPFLWRATIRSQDLGGPTLTGGRLSPELETPRWTAYESV